jgi:hypothetical protein
MAKKKLTKAERAEREAEYERVMANVRRTRELAEKAQAKLDAQKLAAGMKEPRTLTAVFTTDEDGWTVARLAEWPTVATRWSHRRGGTRAAARRRTRDDRLLSR